MRKNSYIYISLILIVYIIWAIAVPLLFKLNIANIESVIKQQTGYNIHLHNARLSNWSVINTKFKTDEFEILNKDGSKALDVQKPIISFRLFPLFVGKCHIRSVELGNIQAGLTVDKDLYLGDYLIKLPENNNTKVQLDRLKIKKYSVSLFDKNTNLPINLNGQNIYYKETYNSLIARGENNLAINNENSTVDFDVKIPKKHYIKTSKVNLDIKNFKLSPLTNLLKTLTKNSLVLADGVINLSSDNSNLVGNLSNVKLIMKNSAKSMIFPKEFNLLSNFKLYSNDLKITNFEAKGGNIAVALKGEINKFTSNAPIFNLEINMPESDVREIALLLPPLVVPQFNVYRLKMYPFYGYSKADLKIRGKFPEPYLDGDIHISDAYMIKPIPNAEKATIHIKCIRKKMNIDVVVPAGDNQTVYVTGDIDDYGDNKADLKIRSSKSVNLATAEFVLNPLHEILRFLMGPVPIMEVEGRGNINIRVIGTKKDPHIWGDFNFMNTKALFNDVHHLVLENASGNLNFNDQEAHFVNKTGTVNNQPFFIDGKCTLFGDINFDVKGDNQPLQNLIYVMTDSPMLNPLKKIIPDIQNAKGNADLYLNLTGKLPDINNIKLNENLIPKGEIRLKNNSLVLNKIPIKKAQGTIKFKCLDVELDLASVLDDMSKISVFGKVKESIADISVESPRMNLREFTKEKFKEFDDCFVAFKAHYKGDVQNIEYDKIQCVGHVIKNNKPVRGIKILSGNLNVKHGHLKLSNVYGFVKQNPFNIDIDVNNFKRPRINGHVYAKNFDLRCINFCKNSDILPQQLRKELNNINIQSGNADFNAKIRNNKINAITDLKNISGTYALRKTPKSEPLYVPLKLIHSELAIKNNRIFINKMNCLVDNMPVLVYGNIGNIIKKPKIDIHINSKLVQRTFDKYWNVDNIYPIKVKGDILLGSRISGTLDKINTKLDFKLEENSSIYYMGATVGDTENPITVNTDFDIIKNNIIRLNHFQYSKLISSQNNKQNIFPLVTVKGGITYYNKKFYKFDNLIVKTESPTDARIFNVLFKKPTIKHGQFTSDLRINGKSTSPKILGDMTINGIDMPFLNTTIKDLSLNFDDKDILIRSKGEVLSNNVICNAVVDNKFSDTYRVRKADINLKHLDVNSLMDDLRQLELKTFNENQTVVSDSNMFNSMILDDLTLHADSVTIKNMRANNLNAKCSLNEKMLLSVDKFSFAMADGKIAGNVKLNLLNNLLRLRINANNVNANELLIALFDVPNQIFGKLTGTIDLMSNVTSEKTGKETLSGKAIFTVKDGRMPKLGSMEYLLRAGNVFKSGITGITMNSILDLVTPLKTGEFSSIDGSISLAHGVAEKIEIHSESKDLNLFIKGKYNLVTEVADMQVLGQLSRKISTVFGTVGNVSLNSLFNRIPGVNLSENGQLVNELNKIPGIELSNKAYRKFVVEIFGDINNENNVKSFRWIN